MEYRSKTDKDLERRDRPWIYRSRWAMAIFGVAGFVVSVVTWDLLAVLGWVAAICGALAFADARGRDVRRDF